jgi:pyruvate dehydrogenase E1 component
MAATAGRTTLLGEGLQHQDGHSLVLASTVPACQAYDPAFAYEVGAIVQGTVCTACTAARPDRRRARRLLLPHALQRELRDAAAARRRLVRRGRQHRRGGRRAQGLYRGRRTRGTVEAGDDPVLGPPTRRRARRSSELAEHYDVGAELWSATSYKLLREEALAAERWNRLHPSREREVPS